MRVDSMSSYFQLTTFYLPYLFLGLSLIYCWKPGNTSTVLFWLSILSGLWFGIFHKEVFFVLLALGSCIIITRVFFNTPLKLVAHGCFTALSFLLFFHQIAGFSNIKVFDNLQVCETCSPFTMYLNTEGSLIAFVLISMKIPLAHSEKDWGLIFKTSLTYLIACVLVVIIGALSLGYVKFEPKFPSQTFVFAFNNLILVCIAEEAFFRGYIQKHLENFCDRNAHPRCLALIGSSLLFGLRHFNSGVPMILLSTLAGLFYGAVYMKTNRLETSVLVHFGLNMTHFLLFSYPFLVR